MSNARPSPVHAAPAAEAPGGSCPSCGLTARELRDTGRMGCATCYRAFADMVARATAELHDRPAAPPPPSEDRNPWPTRRARTK